MIPSLNPDQLRFIGKVYMCRSLLCTYLLTRNKGQSQIWYLIRASKYHPFLSPLFSTMHHDEKLIVDFPHQIHGSSPNTPRVSFSDHIEGKIVENLSHKHKTDLWFTHDEMKSFKTQTVFLLRSIKANRMTMSQYANMNIQDTSVFMGLERYLSEKTSKDILYKRKAICRAVSSEQQRQLEAGIYDPDEMASVSQAVSDWCRKRARIAALIHAEKR